MEDRVVLDIDDYKDEIELLKPFTLEVGDIQRDKIVDDLLNKYYEDLERVNSYTEKRTILRGVLNTLGPNTLDKEDIYKMDTLLISELKHKRMTDVEELDVRKTINGTQISVWLGDITTLKSDAIVNAANNQLLGCFSPLHLCIDNAIHSAAGPRLRDDCNIIMKKQGFLEPTGLAKITRAYNLPSDFVIHTVGPIVKDFVTKRNKTDLESSYIHCLEVCKKIESIRSITFCSISTGVFGYPIEEASNVAINTVTEWLINNPGELDRVVFNVFSKEDLNYYDIK